ncbi:MAG: folylpolyglutamate synthase/dihydrofolate synthase family protein [Bacteroidales bacterium]
MVYKEVLDFLFSQLPMYQRVGKSAYKADLQTTIDLMKAIGNPEKKLKAIHVAGTNGKGSVSHMIASILQESGYKTGLYTSPHLRDFRERIRLNGEMISEDEVISFVEKYKEVFKNLQPSFFEMTVAMAFEFFAKNQTDVNVVEVGMGGRLDSTNILNPDISLITNIGLDHVQFLGDTIDKIAREKAGIIKSNTPVVIGETQNEARFVFEDIANANSCKLIFADQEYEVRDISFKDDSRGSILSLDIYKNGELIFKDLLCPLTGSYQVKNILHAFAAVQELIKLGYHIQNKDIYSGLQNVVKNTHLLGRWQWLSQDPRVLCDTGHNVEGVCEILKRLKTIQYKKLHFVLGMVNDKNISGVMELLPKDAKYYFCKANIPRGMDAIELRNLAADHNLEGEVYDSVQNALTQAKGKCGENDLVFVGGSTFTVAEVV